LHEILTPNQQEIFKMTEVTTRIATIVSATTSGEGSVVSTIENVRAQADSRFPAVNSERARIFLNVTALTAGSSPTMDVVVTYDVDGVDVTVGTFTQSTEGASSESIVVEVCPAELKVVYTAGGTVADFDATVDVVRFY